MPRALAKFQILQAKPVKTVESNSGEYKKTASERFL